MKLGNVKVRETPTVMETKPQETVNIKGFPYSFHEICSADCFMNCFIYILYKIIMNITYRNFHI